MITRLDWFAMDVFVVIHFLAIVCRCQVGPYPFKSLPEGGLELGRMFVR